jgi:type VI secretion system protein ImpH
MADMATDRRHAARSLIDELFSEPQGFDLLQAIALIERWRGDPSVALGSGVDPEMESVRIEQDCTLAFPASDVTAISVGDDGRPVLKTPVIGLAGVSGPLPYAFTEGILERLSRRDRASAAFLDIFNHRLASIFYRIFRAGLPLLDGHPEASVVGTILRSVVGIGTKGLANRLNGVPDRMLLSCAGILADRRHSAAGLEAVLVSVFGVRAEVRSFEGGWLRLAEENLTILGRKETTQALRLGDGAVLGRRVWDQHAGFVACFRFQSLADFEEMLPTGKHCEPALSLCRFHAGEWVDLVLELRLAAGAVPPLRLSAVNGRRLGWTSWILGAQAAAKADGCVRIVVPANGGEPDHGD